MYPSNSLAVNISGSITNSKSENNFQTHKKCVVTSMFFEAKIFWNIRVVFHNFLSAISL